MIRKFFDCFIYDLKRFLIKRNNIVSLILTSWLSQKLHWLHFKLPSKTPPQKGNLTLVLLVF